MGSARTNATARNEYRRRLRKRGFSEDEIAELVAQRDERRALGLPALPVDALPRVRTCRNAAGQPKQAFRSKRSALMALSKTSTTDRDGRSTALLSPYLCPNCSLWHLGNARPSRTNRRP